MSNSENLLKELKFTGLWLPKEIVLDTNLGWLQKNIWSIIHSMQGEEGCYASDEYFSKLFKRHPKYINRKIKGLIDLGYIIKIGFDGRKRYLKTTMQIRGHQKVTPRSNQKVTTEVTKRLPLPQGDTIYDNKVDRKAYIKESKPKKTVATAPLASEEAHASSPFSKEIEEIIEFLLTSILSIRPNFKVNDLDLKKWEVEIDRMIRLDNQDTQEIKKILMWLPTNDFWKKNILSASKLRKQFDKLCIECDIASDQKTKYKNFAYKVKRCENLKSLNISDTGIHDPYNNNFELSFKMPYEDFCRSLANKYGISDYEGDME